jgi:hypothetical protein
MTVQDSIGLHEALVDEGWRRGLPPRRPMALVNGPAIDREVAATSACEHCGHQGLQYQPYVNDEGGYSAVAVCPQCGAAEEF